MQEAVGKVNLEQYKTRRRAYVVLHKVRADDGQYIPCLVIEGVPGYFKTDKQWGDDFEEALQRVDIENAKLGVTRDDAFTIVGCSLLVQNGKEARQPKPPKKEGKKDALVSAKRK